MTTITATDRLVYTEQAQKDAQRLAAAVRQARRRPERRILSANQHPA
jgi:hypothetical protein